MVRLVHLCFCVMSMAVICAAQDGGADGPAKTILTSAHRGEHLRHPANAVPTVQAASDAAVDYVKLDISTTSDGYLVLMHDPAVDRMTNGKGAIKDMTLAQI